MRVITRTELKTGHSGVGILPQTEDGKFVLIRQFRHAPRTWILTIPMGMHEEGLILEESAAKELQEETGAQIVGKLQSLGNIVPDQGYLKEKDVLFHAIVKLQGKATEETEGLDGIELLTRLQLRSAVKTGYYIDQNGKEFYTTDSYLQIAVLRAHLLGYI